MTDSYHNESRLRHSCSRRLHRTANWEECIDYYCTGTSHQDKVLLHSAPGPHLICLRSHRFRRTTNEGVRKYLSLRN
jgi:hypothetical protein